MPRRLALGLALLATLLIGESLRAAATEHQPTAGHAKAESAASEEGSLVHKAGGEHSVVEFDPTQSIWVLIIFLVLLAVLYPTAWKQVLAGLKKREERIRKDIADAEAARQKAEATLKDYQKQLATAEGKVREMIAIATKDGEKIASEIRAKGQQEAEAAKQRAMQDIDAAGKQAVTEIYAKAADLSTSIASKILRRNLNPDDQRNLVEQSLAEMQNAPGNRN